MYQNEHHSEYSTFSVLPQLMRRPRVRDLGEEREENQQISMEPSERKKLGKRKWKLRTDTEGAETNRYKQWKWNQWLRWSQVAKS